MRLKKERITALSKAVLEHLLEAGAVRVEAGGERPDLTIERTITEELLVEDRLDAEVRKILDSYESEIAKGNVDPHQMFLMVKKQLAKERGIIL
ncbi:MAG TPA: DUF507 family protein [Nitrospiria bacterium]|nr:DUF507 family protein [Nitrospiria bacterium]